MNRVKTFSAVALQLLIVFTMAWLCGCSAGRKDVSNRTAHSRASSPIIYRGVMTAPAAVVDDANEPDGRRKIGISKEHIEELARMKVNLIRWQMTFPGDLAAATKEQYLDWLHTVVFERLNTLLPICDQYGIKVILDLHSGPGGVVSDRQRCLVDPYWKDILFEVWKEIITTYKDYPAVLGYDLLNEPQLNVSDYSIWNDTAAELTKQIREDSPKVIVIETLRDNMAILAHPPPV